MNFKYLLLTGIVGIQLQLPYACTGNLAAQKDQIMTEGETRNEIVLLIRKNSGVSVESGRFISEDPGQVEKINRLLAERQGEIRKIGIQNKSKNPEELPQGPDFSVVYVSGNSDQFLHSLREESWIESAFLKPKSEDPGIF